jgi:hypothetical protein
MFTGIKYTNGVDILIVTYKAHKRNAVKIPKGYKRIK